MMIQQSIQLLLQCLTLKKKKENNFKSFVKRSISCIRNTINLKPSTLLLSCLQERERERERERGLLQLQVTTTVGRFSGEVSLQVLCKIVIAAVLSCVSSVYCHVQGGSNV